MALRLDRLASNMRIANADGTPTNAMILYVQRMCERIETSVNGIAAAQAAAAAANSAAAAANSAAATAQTAADTATNAADQVTADTALANSSATGLTITAADVGADVTATISAHTRVYGDGTSVAVSGGTVTGLAYSTSYWLIYNDPTRAGGAVTYTASTTVQGNGTPAGQHFVGSVATPAAAGPPSDGNPVLPPGANVP